MLNRGSSHVTDRVKNLDLRETTQNPSDEASKHGLSKASEKRHEYSKKVLENESSVYLDDVLFTLKSQEWSEEEKPCLDHIYRLLYGLQNFTLWAVWGKSFTFTNLYIKINNFVSMYIFVSCVPSHIYIHITVNTTCSVRLIITKSTRTDSHFVWTRATAW